MWWQNVHLRKTIKANHSILSPYHQTEILSWFICKVTGLISMSATLSCRPADLQSESEVHGMGGLHVVYFMLFLCEHTLNWLLWSAQSSLGHNNTGCGLVCGPSFLYQPPVCAGILCSGLAFVTDANTICFLAAQKASPPPTVSMFIAYWWQGRACQPL